jgi:hypothetical protein
VKVYYLTNPHIFNGRRLEPGQRVDPNDFTNDEWRTFEFRNSLRIETLPDPEPKLKKKASGKNAAGDKR